MEVVATEVYRFKVNHINSRFRYNKEWYNTNKLLRRPGFLGIKTGITVTAGPKSFNNLSAEEIETIENL